MAPLSLFIALVAHASGASGGRGLGRSAWRVQRPLGLIACASSAHELSSDVTFATAASGRLPAALAARAAALGFERPTAVQAEALDVLLDGHDAIIHASTGSGKTLAYLLPLLAGVDPTHSVVQAIVIVPTRELGVQVAKLARQLAAGLGAPKERPSVMLLLDRSHAARERRWLLAEPPNVIVGNPDAVLRAVQTRALRTAAVRLVVVDEADQCAAQRSDALALLLAGGASAAVNGAAQPAPTAASAADGRGAPGGVGSTHAPAEAASAVQAAAESELLAGAPTSASALIPACDARQTVFVSASIPQHRHFIKSCVGRRWMRAGARHVHVAPDEAVPGAIRHRYVVCEPRERVRVLRGLLRAADRAAELDGALVFCRDGRPLEKLRAALEPAVGARAPGGGGSGGGAEAVRELRADDGAAVRYRTIAAVRSREARVLVAELGLGAHRGLDLPHMSHVFLLDSTSDSTAYLHAAGRTGRLGRVGTVVTLVGRQELFALRRLGNALNIEISELELQLPSDNGGDGDSGEGEGVGVGGGMRGAPSEAASA
jgi:superfamily II DNA/RNA helicase